MAINETNVTILVPSFWFYRKLKVSLAEKHLVSRENRLHDKIQRLLSSTLNSWFKISVDMTKLGSFYFGFVLLYVDGKINPVLFLSGTN